VSLRAGAYEYSGTGAQGLFGQPSNLLSLRHWRMSADILRFFREAQRLVGERDGGDGGDGGDETLGDWLVARGYSGAFIEDHILPMGAAIWSTPSRDILDFPAAAFARFFANHGLLQVRNRPEWRTVAGGSRAYVQRIMTGYRGRVVSGDGVAAIIRGPGEVTVRCASGTVERFDRCLVACHADEALALLADADADEQRLLGAFRYASNEAVLHRDAALMPRRRRLWSSWNYLGGTDGTLAVSYWMNRLQPLATEVDHFVTLNPPREIPTTDTVARFAYQHPMFDRRAIAAQRALWSLQGRRQTWFAGSYFGWGFHEDGLQAGLAAAEELGGVARPWQVAAPSGRIARPAPASGGERRDSGPPRVAA
jgi:predicted NAD/FAD-binding protein